MKHTPTALMRATRAVLGGPTSNPYYAHARAGDISRNGSDWVYQSDIRSPVDGRWGPTGYGGDVIPTYGKFLVELNEGHPVIEPLFHPKLTHKQKMVRLYKRCLKELIGLMNRVDMQRALYGYYARQVRDEFEKNRDADKGTAEWLFVRAINYIDSRKQSITYGQEHYPGNTSFGRYQNRDFPDEFSVFPHGFDPGEAYKLMNPYHKFGIPYSGRGLAIMRPHVFMMRPIKEARALVWTSVGVAFWSSVSLFFLMTFVSVGQVGSGFPSTAGAGGESGAASTNRPFPVAKQLN